MNSLKSTGYSSFIIPSSENILEEEHAIQTIRNYSVDGVIFVDNQFYGNRSEVSLGKPSVFINRRVSFPGQTWVGPDDRYGARLAVNHLAQIGHVRIAHILGHKSYPATQQRLLGYQDVLKARGLPIEGDFILEGDWSIASGYYAAQVWLKKIPSLQLYFQRMTTWPLGQFMPCRMPAYGSLRISQWLAMMIG